MEGHNAKKKSFIFYGINSHLLLIIFISASNSHNENNYLRISHCNKHDEIINHSQEVILSCGRISTGM
jgi:hypothetical protein